MKKMYNPGKNLLENRVILVTGAGDGIGKQAAITFAEFGAELILLGRKQEKLESVYDMISKMDTPKPCIVPFDLELCEEIAYSRLATKIQEDYGRLDGLLHNAAILGPRVPIENYAYKDWEAVMQVNINSVFLLTKFLLALLKKSDDGRLIFTNSGVGQKPRAYWGAYSISKYALNGLAKLVADELENTSNVVVTSVNPGATRTKMRNAAYPGENPDSVKPATNLMPLYLYLAGPDSRNEHNSFFSSEDDFSK